MKSTNDYAFGNLITALRTERGFSQFQLGKLLGVSDKAVSKWENGNAKPRIATCYRLADILGISLDELLSSSNRHLVPLSAPDRNPDKYQLLRDSGIAEGKALNNRSDHAAKKRVELHMRTGMSISDGIVEARDLAARTAEWGMPAVAITDFCNTRSFPFVGSSRRRVSQKIIFGCEGFVVKSTDAAPETGYHVMLLALNREGLINLNKLISLSYAEYFSGLPCMPVEIIGQHRQGLLIGSSCESGEIVRMMEDGASWDALQECASFYDYLEVQPIENELVAEDEGNPYDRSVLEARVKKIVLLGDSLNIPVVAVSNGRYLDPEDGISRAVLQYSDGLEHVEEQPPYYLRTTEEMLSCFAFLGEDTARKIVIDSSLRIANLADDEINLYPSEAGVGETLMPELPNAEQHLKELALLHAHELYGNILPSLISDRLNKEFSFLSAQNGWPILEIAWLAVSRSLQEGYPVGSRGSIGSSLVAFLIGISRVNPLPPHYVCGHCHFVQFEAPANSDCGADLPDKICPRCGNTLSKDGYHIPVESLLGLDGKRQLDVDLNFSAEVQGRIHTYICDYFGADHVFHPGTISGLADSKAKKLTSQYATDHHLNAESPELKRAAEKISWTARALGQHPGGLFIVPEGYNVNEFTAIQHTSDHSKDDIPASHYDFNMMYDKLLKMDFLGHDTPTMLSLLQQKSDIAPENIPLHDEKVLSLFTSPCALGIKEKDLFHATGTIGIPEFGTTFVQDMLHETKPSTVEDLIRISGLSHGTDVWVENVKNIIANGTANLYDCPATRDDITNYLVRHYVPFDTAFTISEYVRKGKGSALGLKSDMLVAMHQAEIPDWYIESCQKIKYLFPRAHAVSYVTDSLRLTWYKLYHPAAFYQTRFIVCGETLEVSDLEMDIIHLRKAILSTRMELQDLPDDFDFESYEIRAQKKDRLSTLMLLLEMKLRGYQLTPDDLKQ